MTFFHEADDNLASLPLTKWRIGVAGAGAVGGHYGLMLQQAGMKVRFLARGAHLQAMQAAGLRHVAPDGVLRCMPVQCSDNPALLRDCHVILLACKTTQLPTMLASLATHAASAALISMQNGVDAPAQIARVFPTSVVIAASAFIGARVEPAGTIIHSAAGHIRLAPWQGNSAKVLQVLTKVWQQAGTGARILPDARRMLWHKMLWNCGFNAITALTRRYAREIAADASCRAHVEAAMQEALAVAQAEGVTLEQADIASHIALTLKAGEVKTSMWQDVLHGRETEIEAMNGRIVALAQQYGIAVPVNRMLSDLIRALTA